MVIMGFLFGGYFDGFYTFGISLMKAKFLGFIVSRVAFCGARLQPLNNADVPKMYPLFLPNLLMFQVNHVGFQGIHLLQAFSQGLVDWPQKNRRD